MGLRSPRQFIESLRDGRVLYYRGERVPDVTVHPILGVAVKHAALDFQLAEDPLHQDLMTCVDPETGERVSRFFKTPTGPDDLLKRMEMIELSTRVGGGVVLLIKEIGTDALFALHLVTRQVDKRFGTGYGPRLRAYHRYCQAHDLSMAVAQTDVKGDRSLRPSQQAHPDYYLRVVEEGREGIVVRGCKAHTTGPPYANELVVLPTRALTEEARDYAVAFALPVAAPGLTFIASALGFDQQSDFHRPVSTHHKMIETLTIFDDVFVPWERVFLKGEWEYAGLLANTFVEYHRFSAISYKPPLCHLLLGAASLMAEYNGIGRAAHVRDKLTALIRYVENLRALTRMAAIDCRTVDGEVAVPDPILTNIAKYHFARGYHEVVRDVQDIAGGLLVTGPSAEDLGNPATRGYIERYLGGKAGVSAAQRLRLLNLIRDLTASDFGGYNEVLAIHAEGSLEAQKLTIYRDYDLTACRALARRMAGITE